MRRRFLLALTRAPLAALALVLLMPLQPLAADSLVLELPGGSETLSNSRSALDSYGLPVAPFADGELPQLMLQGQVQRSSWRVASQGLTSLQLLLPLREQLLAAGYELMFECDTLVCGGFDFRFETEVLPAPAMHVDLADFRFLSASRGDDDHLSLLVSRSANAGFVQLIRVTDTVAGTVTTNAAEATLEAAAAETAERVADGGTTPTADSTRASSSDGLEAALLQQGHVVLDDLDFETGSAKLGDSSHLSLAALAAFLAADPTRRILLVGHTDAVGDLAGNIALSKRRAASVRQRLIETHGADGNRIGAEGTGYLAPRASNLTEAGRQANRRVEAVLLNTR